MCPSQGLGMHGMRKIYLKIKGGLFWRKVAIRITEFGGIGGRRLVRMCWATTSEVLPIRKSVV